MKKQRILFPIGSFFPAQSGGPNNTIYFLAKALVANGYEVTVATTMEGITQEHRRIWGIRPNHLLTIDGIQVIFVPQFPVKRVFDVYLWGWMIRHLGEFDLVHLSSFFSFYTLLGGLLGSLKRKKLILSTHGELEAGALTFKPVLKQIYLRLVSPLFSKIPFHVTAPQEALFCQKYFPHTHYFILPNLTEIAPEVGTGSSRQGVLYLGRLHPKKGINRLIQAFSRLPKALRDQHPLTIAGTGSIEAETELTSLVSQLELSSCVQFVGHVEGDAKARLFSTTQVFVLPSHSENFGIVVTEAMNYGAYVITSTKTPWQILQDKGIGSWVDNDPDTLATELTKVLTMDEQTYCSKTVAAREFLKASYDVQAHVGGYLEMYQRVMNE